jgi:hypothetical protein
VVDSHFVHLTQHGLVMQFPSGEFIMREQIGKLIGEIQSLYCNEQTEFRYAKWMEEGLRIELVGPQSQLTSAHKIAPSDCPASSQMYEPIESN